MLPGVTPAPTPSPGSTYARLVQDVEERVGAGVLRPGDRLPTVRAWAAEAGLAPNTVARAVRELEARGVVETRGRAGTFVAGPSREAAARAAAHVYAVRTLELGLDADEAVALLRRTLAALTG